MMEVDGLLVFDTVERQSTLYIVCCFVRDEFRKGQGQNLAFSPIQGET